MPLKVQFMDGYESCPCFSDGLCCSHSDWYKHGCQGSGVTVTIYRSDLDERWQSHLIGFDV